MSPPPLTEMLAALTIEAPPGLPETLTGLTADSRQVRPGMLYAALQGARHDGRAFIPQAIAQGAAAILALPGTTADIPVIHSENPRRTLAKLAALQAGPQPKTLIAITGTNGKTSTADFLRQLLTLHGQKAASLGTLGILPPLPSGVGRGEGTGPAHQTSAPTTLTTPDPIQLAETLAHLARTGVTAAAIEASSHGLDQYRLDGLNITAAAFTNLTRDHLDYHQTMDAYRDAKLRLFTDLLPEGAPAIASTTLDQTTLQALSDIAKTRHLDLQTTGDNGNTIRLIEASPHATGQTLIVEADGTTKTIDLPLPGRFQAENALLAAALAQAAGVENALDLLPHLTGVRGRMELAVTHNGAPAYVDYAHTPDALERLLQALRPHTKGRLILVFGAGGDRDPGKRPLMGAIAQQHADIAIITDDNPRSESPAAIRAAIQSAAPNALNLGDRAQAIAKALSLLKPGDVLAVAGKGHESGQTTAGITAPFDDAQTLRALASQP